MADDGAPSRCGRRPRYADAETTTCGFAYIDVSRGWLPVRGDRLGIFSVSPERFRCHVEILAKTARVHAVSLDPLHMPQHQLNVAVTFDDGYQDNLRVAAPILIENGIPFSVFVTTDFIRQATKGFLSPLELREITSLPGVTVGAHGRSHRSLTECSDQDLAEELTGSRQYLEDLLGCGLLPLLTRMARRTRGYVQQHSVPATRSGCAAVLILIAPAMIRSC